MKQVLLMIAVVALVGCGKEAVSSEDANSLNAEVVRQGLEKEIDKLRAKNRALEAALAAAKNAPPPQPKPNLQVAPRPLPKGVAELQNLQQPHEVTTLIPPPLNKPPSDFCLFNCGIHPTRQR